jgi:hypothetical protein
MGSTAEAFRGRGGFFGGCDLTRSDRVGFFASLPVLPFFPFLLFFPFFCLLAGIDPDALA